MVDRQKRNTLKTLSGAAALAVAPAAIGALPSSTAHDDISMVIDHLKTHVATLGLDVTIVPTPEHASMWVRFTNVSNSTVILDHVAPSLIRSGGALYDVSSPLHGTSVSMRPQEHVAWIIEPV